MTPSRLAPPRRARLDRVALCVLGLAFALRVYGVGRQAFRGDEAFSVVFVSQPLAQMFRSMALTEPNPPLYSLILRGWLSVAAPDQLMGGKDLAAASELFARWPSVLAGVAAVALTYRLIAALGGQRVALIAMLLAAAAPFLIW
jgi:uncharacterized membrane protein